MQTLPAQELKRRGVAALDDLLPHGPVQVMRNNRPAAVVLSVEEYARLKAAEQPRRSIWDIINEAGTTRHSKRTREDIDAQIREERDSWERR